MVNFYKIVVIAVTFMLYYLPLFTCCPPGPLPREYFMDNVSE